MVLLRYCWGSLNQAQLFSTYGAGDELLLRQYSLILLQYWQILASGGAVQVGKSYCITDPTQIWDLLQSATTTLECASFLLRSDKGIEDMHLQDYFPGVPHDSPGGFPADRFRWDGLPDPRDLQLRSATTGAEGSIRWCGGGRRVCGCCLLAAGAWEWEIQVLVQRGGRCCQGYLR